VDLRNRALNRSRSDAVFTGVEIVGTVVVAFVIGWALDSWLNTTPLFMLGLTVLAVVAKGVVSWYTYDAQMRAHEADLHRTTALDVEARADGAVAEPPAAELPGARTS
jgi:F0F1-type ATP synthase assembly protein I